MRRLCGLAVGLLLLAAPAVANEAVVLDGNRLLAACRELLRGVEHAAPTTFLGGVCTGFITGMVDMQFLYHEVNPETPRLFCAPEGLQGEQSARVVLRFLERHPGHLYSAATSLIVQALHEAFPCTPAPPARTC